MMTFRDRGKLLCLAFAGMLAVVWFGHATIVDSVAANATMRVGYPQPSGAMLPLWLVSDAKLDQKYGVPVQSIFISGAARMNQSMVAGDIDLASIGGAVVNTVLAGGDLVAIAVGVPTYGFSLYGRPEVKDIASLQGKVVGIMSKGASSEHAVIACSSVTACSRARMSSSFISAACAKSWPPLTEVLFPPGCCRRPRP
jgi:ABC-type nitrate/sulfonate/bicarbonate transport system substrate-binding protein